MKSSKILLGASMVGALASCSKTEQKPNVIYIIMDDLGLADPACYGSIKIETPNIDQLYNDGIHFTNSYSGCPVSAPARCVLQTGMHLGHAQIRRNNEMAERGAVNNYDSMYVHPFLEGQKPLKAGTMTLGRMMQEAGYKTGCFGKWGLGYPGSEGTPNKMGFDRFYGYNCQRQAHTHFPPFLYSDEERVYLDNKLTNPHQVRLPEGADPYDWDEYKKLEGKEFAHDLIFDNLMEFVDSNKENQFFVMWTTPLPHVSLMAPERWVKYYVDKYGDEEPYDGHAGYQVCRYPHATYAAMVSYFDEQIGKLVAKLKEDGIYENTVIFFTSDNGPTYNGGTDSPWFDSAKPYKSEYGWGKGFVHEGGIRVPSIAVWDGKIKAGSSSDLMICFQDVMPTLADIAGIKSPECDGISYFPTLIGKGRQQEHEYLYWEYLNQIAIRCGDWKGIIMNSKKSDEMWIFNVKEDPREQNNVAAEHPELVERFRAYIEESHTPEEL